MTTLLGSRRCAAKYACCPETMRAVGERLEVRVITGLYRAPTRTPGEDWPEPIAQR